MLCFLYNSLPKYFSAKYCVHFLSLNLNLCCHRLNFCQFVDFTILYFQEPRFSWGSTGTRWKGIAAVCYCQWFPKYSEFGSEDETRKEQLPLCWSHGLSIRYSLSFGYVLHICIIPLYHVIVHHGAARCPVHTGITSPSGRWRCK
jgi:hypothetical protein